MNKSPEQVLEELKQIKNNYIQKAQGLPLQELQFLTIQFLDQLISYRSPNNQINRQINQYWQLAYNDLKLKVIEEQIKEEKKGR